MGNWIGFNNECFIKKDSINIVYVSSAGRIKADVIKYSVYIEYGVGKTYKICEFENKDDAIAKMESVLNALAV